MNQQKRPKILKNQKGMALLLALFTMMFIFYLVTEILYSTNVEYTINANAVHRLKAYYAARSGYELSLLRIKIYMQIKKQIEKQLNGKIPSQQAKLLDMIWSFPFAWPPVMPGDMLTVEKEAIQEKVKASLMTESYRADIFDEGSKIDINDLKSPSKTIQESTQKLLLQIFENKITNDKEWAKIHQNFRPQELINNIIDWIDADTTSLNSGNEGQFYSRLGSDSDKLPPNRGFRTPNELRMVAGMREEYFQLLNEQITTYGMKAINPNHASAEILSSFDSSMKKEVVDEIIKRREDSKQEPFRDATTFWQFVQQSGGAVSSERQKEIPLTFDSVYNFRIRSIGESANQIRQIEAVVFDFDQISSIMAQQLLDDRTASSNGNQDSKTNSNDNQNNNQNKKTTNSNVPLPKGPPRVVYFFER